MDNPANQFIEIAPDSPTKTAIVPQEKNGKPSIATIEYELLNSKPYAYTLAELKFATHAQRVRFKLMWGNKRLALTDSHG